MDILKLRTLALKSKLDGGKYVNHTVEKIIQIDKNYLIKQYFTFSKINYTEEVLQKLGLSDYVISKPGVDDDMWHKFNLDRLNKLTDFERLKHFVKKKKNRIKKAKLMMARHINDDRQILKKGNLKAMNNQNRGARIDLHPKYRTK